MEEYQFQHESTPLLRRSAALEGEEMRLDRELRQARERLIKIQKKQLFKVIRTFLVLALSVILGERLTGFAFGGFVAIAAIVSGIVAIPGFFEVRRARRELRVWQSIKSEVETTFK